MTKNTKKSLKVGFHSLVEKRQISKQDVPAVLNIFLPGKCNLQCTYCFVHKEKKNFDDIDEKAIKKAIDIFLAYIGKHKTLSFNGGEPLLEWNLIRTLCEYAKVKAKKNGIALDIIIVTNGTLLRQKHIDFFKKNNVLIKISIDGDKKTHDKKRFFGTKKTKSSFDAIMKNIQNIDSESVKFSASLVFGPETVINLLKNIEFLQQKNFKYIDFYPEIYATWNKADLEKLENETRKIEKYYVETFRSKSENLFRTSMLDMLLSGPSNGSREICGKIQVDAMGNFFACDKIFSLPKKSREQYLVGNSKIGIVEEKRRHFLDDNREKILNRTKLKCGTCRFKKYCTCAIGQYVYKKSNNSEDFEFWQSFCEVSKILIAMNLRIIKKLEYDEIFVALNRF